MKSLGDWYKTIDVDNCIVRQIPWEVRLKVGNHVRAKNSDLIYWQIRHKIIDEMWEQLKNQYWS